MMEQEETPPNYRPADSNFPEENCEKCICYDEDYYNDNFFICTKYRCDVHNNMTCDEWG